MIVQDFTDELARRLRDVAKRQWQQITLLQSLNAAIGALCSTIPAASTVHRTLSLKEGTEQEIPEDTHKIAQILHNICVDTGETRRAITLADKAVFDAVYPHWRQDAPRAYIRHYMTDAMNERVFYVWPPAITDQMIRGQFTTIPLFDLDTINSEAENIPLNDIYREPLFEYALYYCYAVDDDMTANSARSNRHWLAFFQLLNKQEDTSLQVMTNREVVE